MNKSLLIKIFRLLLVTAAAAVFSPLAAYAQDGITLKMDNAPLHKVIEALEQQSDYLFLSPIFDSISKQGYSSHFSEQQLMEAGHEGILGPKVIALGGILPEHMPLLGKYGFGGAAFLGYVWKDVTPEAAAKRIRAIRKFKLSY